MNSESIIVVDASPLIGLASIDQLNILTDLFPKVIIPEEVRIECTYNMNKPGAQHIQSAIEKDLITISKNESTEKKLEFPKILGAGEIAAMELAYSLKSMLLIDDLWGRKIANYYNIRILGTAGLLVIAKEKNIIPNIPTLLQNLSEKGYRLSEKLITKVISLCGESN